MGGNGESGWYVLTAEQERVFPSNIDMMIRLNHEQQAQNFEVLYIGQAFGTDGSRSALDRLKTHETLQKISLLRIPVGYSLTNLMLDVIDGTRMITLINPRGSETSSGEARIEAGLAKMRSTTEAEKITLYEASLIRYFRPRFNKEFKDSFPSTNMKLLMDCYEKDLAAVIAEICFDQSPVQIFSNLVKPKQYHIITHNLHQQSDRNVFFSVT